MISRAQNCDAQSSSLINDSTFSRHQPLLVIAVLRRIRPLEGIVLILTDRHCVKCGQHLDFSKTAIMRFISQYTSIQVPKIFCAFTHEGCSYVVMERINENIIGIGWIDRSKELKMKLPTQLMIIVQEMQELRLPEGIEVSYVSRRPVFDCFFSGAFLYLGLFFSILSLHQHFTSWHGF